MTDSRITFHGLFSRFDGIEIPIIQRDYAQGRSAAEDVRTGLLEALKDALDKESNDETLPLDLDFIYGTIEEEGEEGRKIFLPLDGQQRLTTLFLLHWYSAWRGGESEVFKETFTRDGKSTFSYSVRPSSMEFFDSLSQWFPDEPDPKNDTPSELLQEQPWFFLYWKQDPTIQSALVMLDSIHEIFSDTESVYGKLCDSNTPHITFQLLELEQFGLSDDLYIKMNARGKPLTVFENFKARVEQYLSSSFPDWQEEQGGNLVSIKNYFSHKIETSWADLFWHYRDKDLNLFDDQIMGLFRALVTVTRDPEAEDFEDTWQEIRDLEKPLTFQRCQKLECTDKHLFQTFFSLLDKLEGQEEGISVFLDDPTYFHEEKIFEKAITRRTSLTYEELIQFHAYAGFLLRHDEVDSETLGEWMRVISNLAQNTIYNRLDDYQRSMRALNQLFEHSASILTFLATTEDPVSGFNEQQVREEKLKAELIQKSQEWQELIFEAEQHGYFAGQIEFLFKFSGVLDHWLDAGSCDWNDAEDETFQNEFRSYLDKATSVFDNTGLKEFEESLWERALLSNGDYLVSSGRNFCLLRNESRELSWKRLLRGNPKNSEDEERRMFVKALLDKIDPGKGAASCLREVIENTEMEKLESWRRILVAEPKMIDYCEKRMMRWNGAECIYLMRRIQMNGLHAELFSYHLYVSKLESLVEGGGVVPLRNCQYASVADSETEPHILMEIESRSGVIEIGVSSHPGDDPLVDIWIVMKEGEMPDEISAVFLEEGKFGTEGEPDDPWLEKSVPRKDIEEELGQLAELIRKRDLCEGSKP